MKLSVNGLMFSYSSTPVLKDVTFELAGSKFVSIMGPNGVGKSTLIHCINKILTPTEGVVTIDETNVLDYSLKDMAKIVGYVPYSSSDTFPLTVVDTVLMGRHPYSKWNTLDHDLDIVYETLKRLGISSLAMRPFNELSAGQHQKVMLARGLVQEPKILLLDEPTSNLDVRHQIDVVKMLRDLAHEKNILVIMISHDINIAAKYSDEVIMLNDGTIYAVGTPNDVITPENLRVVYGVESVVIQDEGMPHVILRDAIPLNEDEESNGTDPALTSASKQDSAMPQE